MYPAKKQLTFKVSYFTFFLDLAPRGAQKRNA